MSQHDGDNALTEKQFRHRAEAKRRVALGMVEDREHCREAWVAAGFAVEFALKALIMRENAWANWPSSAEQPHVHVHNLRVLMQIANIDLAVVPKKFRAPIRQILDWERRHDYHGKIMPRKIARSMTDAAFGEAGVVEWLNQK